LRRSKAGCLFRRFAIASFGNNKKGLTEKELKKTVDPDSYFSPKGWKLLLEKACAEGNLMRIEKPKKRGKQDVLYIGL
jgi:hypothetical protein